MYLTYQKIVIGTFSSVQCVDVQDLRVLLIRGNVKCYTWWQIGILVYISISIVPFFFALAHLPFCIKDKKMSVRTFMISCLFPLPLIIGYYLLRIWKKFSDRGRGETTELSRMCFE